MSSWAELIGNVVVFLFVGAMFYLLVAPLPKRGNGTPPDD
jgi:hypothetical protein